MSRQCLEQRAALAAGKCRRQCGRPLSKLGGVHCDECREKALQKGRAATGCQPWRFGEKGRTPLGKLDLGRQLRADALAKLSDLERAILLVMPIAERRALRAKLLTKLTRDEISALRLYRFKS